MEESEIKLELIDEGENCIPPNLKNESDSTETNLPCKSIDKDAAPVKKKPKMEIELDFSLLENKYMTRDRHKVTRYIDTLYKPETRRKRIVNEIDKNGCKIKDEELTCNICQLQFKEIRNLKTHRHLEHTNIKFICALCSATFNCNAELIKHKIVHADENRNFLCMKCETAFSDHLEYLKHVAKHQKTKNYYCIECGKEFDYRKGYNLHIETHYLRIVECDVCQRKVNFHRLSEHMKSHKDTNKANCVECGKEYEKTYMGYHMTSHTGIKPFQCLYCGKGFSNQNQRKIHTRIHTGEKPFECKMCPRRYAQYTDMSRHMQTHHSANQVAYTCDVCNKKFKHKESLKYHMDIHNNTERYTCQICGFKVNTGTGLKSHVQRAHTDEKKYKCIPCGVAFKANSDLVKHRKNKKHLNNQYGYDKRIKKEKNILINE